jgi:8-oxo-dGDP phosphatase
MSEGPPAWFETLDSREVYSGFSTVRIDTVQTPDGEQIEREIVERVDAVAVVPVDTEDRILLLRQYRQAVGGYLLELPAGLLDKPGEEPEVAARRELSEELRYDAGELEHLTTFVSSAGWSNEWTHVYLARGCTPGTPPDGFVAEAEEADMEVVALPAEEAIAGAHSGAIVDAKSVIGLLLSEPKLTGR